MEYLFKKRKAIALGLCLSLIFSLFTFMPSGVEVTAENLTEEAALEKKIIDPEKGAEYDGYIVAIKDKAIDKVSDGDTSDEFEASPSDKYYLVETTEEALELASASSIEILEPNYIIYQMDTKYPPNDINYSNAPSGGITSQKDTYEFMGIDALWDVGIDGEGVNVAVIDSGINQHQDMGIPSEVLLSKIISIDEENSNIVDDTINNDIGGHGTQVTSLIKATSNNGKNIAGIASKSDITSIRVFEKINGYDVGYNFQVIKALDYLSLPEKTPDVINLSLGSGYPSSGMEAAIKKLVEKKCIIIASTGNYGDENCTPIGIQNPDDICYPAGFDGVVGVGATWPFRSGRLNSNEVAYFSSANESCDVTAWGVYVPVLDPNDNTLTDYNHGTSFSSPIVAGIAACLKQVDPSIDHKRFMDLIIKTSTDIIAVDEYGRNDSYGHGIINARKMLQEFTYSIEYEPYGGTISQEDPNYKTEYNYSGSPVELPIDVTTGSALEFKGWYMDSDLTDGPYTKIPAKTYGDLKLYAKWGTDTSITIDNGSTAKISTTCAFQTTYGAILPEVSKTGYTFGGWYADKAYTQEIDKNKEVGPYDQILYAKWTINSYKITLNSNGGNAVYKANVNHGSQIGSLPSPRKSGYTFMGWYLNSSLTTKLPAGYIIKGNTTLYAKWLSSNATLKKIKPSTSKLSKKFKASTTKYNVTIKKSKGSATIKTTKAVAGQKVQMKIGSGKYATKNSVKVKLKKGKKKIVTIKVTAPDGRTSKTYKVTVKRKK